MTLPKFVPILPYERSPEPVHMVEGIERPKRVDLRELLLGTVIQFYGLHADSKYICLLGGTEDNRQIKIWLKGRGNGAIGTIDELVSWDCKDMPDIKPEKGILELGKYYDMPTFTYYDDKDVTDQIAVQNLSWSTIRQEPYTEIFVKKPSKK